jgi:HSP20 family protein
MQTMNDQGRKEVQPARAAGGFPFLDRDFDDMFEGFFRPMRGLARGAGPLAPALDVTEHDDHYLVHAELPGFRKEDIKVSLDRGQLSIEAETKREEKGEGGRPILRERRYGRFVRSLDVGDGIQPEKIQARYEDGVLEITVPKVAPSSPEVKRIPIG